MLHLTSVKKKKVGEKSVSGYKEVSHSTNSQTLSSLVCLSGPRGSSSSLSDHSPSLKADGNTDTDHQLFLFFFDEQFLQAPTFV